MCFIDFLRGVWDQFLFLKGCLRPECSLSFGMDTDRLASPFFLVIQKCQSNPTKISYFLQFRYRISCNCGARLDMPITHLLQWSCCWSYRWKKELPIEDLRYMHRRIMETSMSHCPFWILDISRRLILGPECPLSFLGPECPLSFFLDSTRIGPLWRTSLWGLPSMLYPLRKVYMLKSNVLWDRSFLVLQEDWTRIDLWSDTHRSIFYGLVLWFRSISYGWIVFYGWIVSYGRIIFYGHWVIFLPNYLRVIECSNISP